MSKKNFFEKLAGSIKPQKNINLVQEDNTNLMIEEDYIEGEENSYSEEVGELSVDMYKTEGNIIVKTIVAGVQKTAIDISLSRDQITIKGSRYNDSENKIDEVYHEELFWGSFERVIDLPAEINIELAEAHESHGLLTLILPLIDKSRQTRIKIK